MKQNFLTLEETRDAFPIRPGRPRPTLRWISRKAKQLGVAHRVGRFIYVREDFYERLMQCPIGTTDEKPKKMVNASGTRGARNLSVVKTEKSDTERLSEVLERLQSKKREK